MKLSKKGEYALRSLIILGIAAEVDRKLVPVTELAESDGGRVAEPFIGRGEAAAQFTDAAGCRWAGGC